MAAPPTNGGLLFNPSFEDGDTGWVKSNNGTGYSPTGVDWVIENTTDSLAGQWSAVTRRTFTSSVGRGIKNAQIVPVYPGQIITASVGIRAFGGSSTHGQIALGFSDGISQSAVVTGSVVQRGGSSSGSWQTSSVSASAPAWAKFVEFIVFASVSESNSGVRIDNASWNYTFSRAATLTSPTNGATFATNAPVTLSVNIEGTSPPVAKVVYKSGTTVIKESSTFPYTATWNANITGAQSITATVVGADGTELVTNAASITVSDAAAGVTITFPTADSVLVSPSTQTIRATVVAGTQPVTSVKFYVDAVEVGESVTAPYFTKWDITSDGSYTLTAKAFNGATEIGESDPVVVSAETANPREYKASNAYTYLLLQNIVGLATEIPSTSTILGVTATINYSLDVISRTKDVENDDPTTATPDVPFDATDNAEVELIMLSPQGEERFLTIGAPLTAEIPIVLDDFTLVETGQSDGKKWTSWSLTAPSTAVLGAEDSAFEIEGLPATDFLTYSFGLRFVPRFTAKPDYAAAGDAAIRFKLHSFRLAVYFTNGAARYFFASPAKDQIISADLVSYHVDRGRFATADARGILQITNLEVLDGSERCVGSDWTIHSAYPPTDVNKIGDVTTIRTDFPDIGMRYNGLPYVTQLDTEYSRYQFISANFYADADLETMYGVSGADRAFAFSTGSPDADQYYYKIYTQPSDEEEKPRHVAYHHGHLALGYNSGIINISVAGEPYNFEGVEGAFSGSIGDRITGLLPLSGTVLGVFGRESVWGISGTTVDNFATQVISPNIGAIEYTLADMGTPIYANAFGIYSLNQTQAYGDYLGIPLSQDVSPYVKPRLTRDEGEDASVLAAVPVRSKNQYRLWFTDGEVLTMTMNGSEARPTFTTQKLEVEGQTVTPRAFSSQFDLNGKERVHMSGPGDVTPES